MLYICKIINIKTLIMSEEKQSINQPELTDEQIEQKRLAQIDWYEKQIVLANYRKILSELNAEAVENELRRKEALIKLAYLEAPKQNDNAGSKEDRKKE